MKRTCTWGLAASAAVLLLWTCAAFSQTASREPAAASKAFVDLLAKGDFTGASRHFNGRMIAALPPEKLRSVWTQLTAQCGPSQKQLATHVQSSGLSSTVLVTCQFERAVIVVKVVWDAQQQIAGLWFMPGKPPATAPSPRYWRPDAFREEPFSVGKEPWVLPGTLTMPKGDGPWPVVVLIHGSGPNDRDETVGANKPFQDLAWGLAAHGVAVLRYDKRTKVYGTQVAAMLSSFTVKEEILDDASAAVAQLRMTKGIDPGRVFVLGHSLGGMLVPRIATLDSDITGFIVMAGCTRPLEEMMLEQTRYLLGADGSIDAADREKVEELAATVAKIQALKPSDAPSATPLLGAAPRYWLALRDYRPALTAKEITRPMLVLQGARDYQVTLSDYENWRNALSGRKNVTFKLYPDLNHLFITGKGKSMPAEYDRPGHIADGVIDDISAFVQQTR